MFNVNRSDWYEALEGQRADIEKAFGQSLNWYPGGKISRIYVKRQVVLADEDQWPEQHAWLIDNIARLRDAIVPHLQKIRAADASQA